MRRNIFLVLLLVALAIDSSFSQTGYIASDSSYSQGFIHEQTAFKNNREALFSIGRDQATVTYLPKDIKEYGLTDGHVYIRKLVKDGNALTAYFLLRLVDGERKLYELKTENGARYFIEGDGVTTEITKETPVAVQLAKILRPCESFQDVSALTSRRKMSLTRTVALNNSCFKGLLPTFRTGVLFGYSTTGATLTSSFDHVVLHSTSASPLVGAFIDCPLGIRPAWFFNFQLYFQQTNFTGLVNSGSQNYDYALMTSVVSLPVFLKYRGIGAKWRPFISAGPVTSYNMQRKNTLLTSTKTGSVVEMAISSFDGVNKIQASAVLNAGLEISLTPKKSVSVELRFAKLVDGSVGSSQSLAVISSFYF